MTDVPDEAIAWVERLHEVIDELTAPLVRRHAKRLACREGCSGCCADGLTVFAIEAARIAKRHANLIADAEPHPEGGCAFLDAEGGCRVYDARPYVCRTQGLPLRWLEREDGEAFEARDVCPKNLEGVALEDLAADECWTLGPIEQRLAERQAAIDGGAGERVALRDMFARSSSARRRLPVVR